MEKIPDKLLSPSSEKNEVLNLKETELRLGLPGSEFLDKKATVFSLFGKDLKDEINKNIFSGAKRVFSDAIDGSNKWGYCINGGSEVDLGKTDVLFSPRGANGGVKNTNILQSSHPAKEIPPQPVEGKKNENGSKPASKAQVVGWPPIRSFHKNKLATSLSRNNDVTEKSGSSCLYVKVSMDGAPYLRKVDLKTHCSYAELSSALEKMFSCFTIGQYASHGLGGKELNEFHLMDLLDRSEYVLTYEDKDGDWMLVGDVPWEMFTDSCKRLRIMKGSEASGLAPRVIEKCKSQN